MEAILSVFTCTYLRVRIYVHVFMCTCLRVRIYVYVFTCTYLDAKLNTRDWQIQLTSMLYVTKLAIRRAKNLWLKLSSDFGCETSITRIVIKLTHCLGT